MNWLKLIALLGLGLFTSCSSFKAERVDSDTSDEKALEITDEWVQRDTERVVSDVVERMLASDYSCWSAWCVLTVTIFSSAWIRLDLSQHGNHPPLGVNSDRNVNVNS